MVDSRGPKVEYQGFSDKDINELPDVIMSKGFDEVYSKEFTSWVVRSKLLVATPPVRTYFAGVNVTL